MLIQSTPDVMTRLQNLGDVTQHEPAGDTPRHEVRNLQAGCIAQVATPTGRKSILKTMLTTACERNCHYCVFRAGRSKTPRATFQPDELAQAYDQMQRKGAVEGAFLSSGIIKGSVTTQDKIIDTAEIIRHKYHNRGYLHLKIMPGAEYDQLLRAMQLADRVSVNLEGPNNQRLSQLAPKKDFFGELLRMLEWAAQIKREHPRQKLASLTTQFVVGAVGESDAELLTVSEKLLQQLGLSRTYFMSFSPVEQTPFEHLPASDPLRERRLYQASFLLRDYGWSAEELPLLDNGNLPLDVDPKIAVADATLRHAPIEIMTADRNSLLRVPGMGHKTVAAILKARQQTTLRDLGQLRKLGLRAPENSAPYILLSGKRPPLQPPLF